MESPSPQLQGLTGGAGQGGGVGNLLAQLGGGAAKKTAKRSPVTLVQDLE